MNKAVLLFSNDGYEALYINDRIVEEGDPINEGFSRTKYFLELSKKYNFNLNEMIESHLSDEDSKEIEEEGLGFYIHLSEYKTNYNK